MKDIPVHTKLREVFTDIIKGEVVKRAKHELGWNGRDVSLEFIEALGEHGYVPMIVQDVSVNAGERAPAFYLENGTAYFGWVFWEKFSSLRLRKLFGSVVRNRKGDWAIQIPAQRKTVIYVNMQQKTEMDIDHPSGI